MLSLAHLEVAVTASDVARMLRSERRPGGPSVRDVQFGPGEVMLKLTVPDLLSLPVDVTITFDGIRDGDLLLRLRWTNLALLPAVVKQAGLGRAVAALGLSEFWDGRGGLAIPLVYIQARLAASFAVERLELTPERLLVRLRHVQAVSPALVRGDTGTLVDEAADGGEGGVIGGADGGMANDADDGMAGGARDGDSAIVTVRPPESAGPLPDPPPAGARRPDDAPPFDARQRRRYDEWRERLLQWSRSKLPPSLQAALPWVLLIPDLSVLLGRMLLDNRLSPPLRALLGAVLVYVLSPVDFVPDPIPVAGAIDDLSLILLTLSELQRHGQAGLMQEHWSGEGEPLRIVRDGLQFLRKRFRNVLRMMQRHKWRLRRRTR